MNCTTTAMYKKVYCRLYSKYKEKDKRCEELEEILKINSVDKKFCIL